MNGTRASGALLAAMVTAVVAGGTSGCSVPPGCGWGGEAELLRVSEALVSEIPGLTPSGMSTGSCEWGSPASYDWEFSGTVAELRRRISDSSARCAPAAPETSFWTFYDCDSAGGFSAEATEGDDRTVWFSVYLAEG